MDSRTQDAIDTTLADELFRNERIIDHPTLGKVKLRRPTPAQERNIANVRRKQYQADMRDPDILSKDQLETIAYARDMWSPEKAERITELTRKLGEAMGVLEAIGFQSIDELIAEFTRTMRETVGEMPADNEKAKDIVVRYFDLDVPPDFEDRQTILGLAESTRADDLLDRGDELRTQIKLLKDMFDLRKEMTDLQVKSVRLFIDSIESRADRAEEMARVYFCATHLDGTPLWPTQDLMWDADTSVIEFVVLEMHYFLQGVTEEIRATLGKFGFTQRLTDTSGGSDASPDQPEPSSAGELLESAPTSSSEALVS